MSDSEPTTPPRGMILDAVFGSEALDSSGEILDVEGADITDLVEGRAEINYEHKDESGKGTSGLDWVGRIIYAKKIFTRKDCDTDRQREFWDELELPFIYGMVRLYDAAGHAGAQALAAIIRDHHANKEKILWRWSVEGTTLKTSPDKKRLLRSVIKAVALTRKPCNRSAETRIIADPQAPAGFDKEPVKVKEEKDFLDDVLKRSEPKFTRPDAARLGSATILDYNPLLKEDQLEKTLTAGSYDAAPSSLEGGAALQREDISSRVKSWGVKAKRALQKWDPGSGKSFRDYLKTEVPEASQEYMDRFADLVEDLQVRKRDILLKKNIRQIQALGVELRKVRQDLIKQEEKRGLIGGKLKGTKGKEKPKQSNSLISWQGKQVRPGRGKAILGGKPSDVDILGGNETHMYVVPDGKITGQWSHNDLKAVPRHGVDVYFHPLQVEEPQVIGQEHGHGLNFHPEQRQLINGIDLAKADKPVPGQNFSSGRSFWAKRPNGAPVYVKPEYYRSDADSADGDGMSDSHREVAYHNLAKALGLGDHVPVTAMARHPRTGQELAVIQGLTDAHHPEPGEKSHLQLLDQGMQRGELGKLAFMDHIMGVADLVDNPGNWMMGKDGKVKRIDHGFAFSTDGGGGFGLPPDYMTRWGQAKPDWKSEPIPQQALQWVQNLSPDRLEQEMERNRIPEMQRGMVHQRLNQLQGELGNTDGPTWGDLYGY
jgi:hypothetical protein